MNFNEVNKSPEDQARGEKIYNILRRDCGGFLSQEVFLFRGIPNGPSFAHAGEEFFRAQTNKDRKPVASSYDLSETLDEVYKEIGSPVSRFSCVFTTPNYAEASSYGVVYVVCPIGDHSILWHPDIQDAFVEFEDGPSVDPLDFKYLPSDIAKAVQAEVQRDMDKINYGDDNPKTAAMLKSLHGENYKELIYKEALKEYSEMHYKDAIVDHGLFDYEKILAKYGDGFMKNFREEPYEVEVMIDVDEYYCIEQDFFFNHVWR